MRRIVSEYIQLFNKTLNFKGLSWWLIDLEETPELFHCNDNMCEAFYLDKSTKDHLVATTCPIVGDYRNNIELSSTFDAKLIFSEYHQLLSQQISEYKNTFPYFDARSGVTHHFSSRAKAIEKNDNGKAALLFGIIEDVTIKVNQSKTFETLSEQDELTKLYNRRKFFNLFEHECKRSLRNQTNIAILMIDVDYFKQYNDIYGHIKGDKCLLEVAKILSQTLKRDVDVIARYGGEEFIVLLSDINDVELTGLAEKLVMNIENAQIKHAGSKVSEYLTISIGGAVGKLLTLDHSLISMADKMLFKVKEQNRNDFAIAAVPQLKVND